jgi:hypothetical protein
MCLSSRFPFVCNLRKLSLHSAMLSGVPQGSTLGPLLISIFITNLCVIIHFPNFQFANILKIVHVIKSADDRKLLQYNTDSVQT